MDQKLYITDDVHQKKGDEEVRRMFNTPIELCKGVRKRRMVPCAVLS
jgi:hypothetical protein